MKNELSKNGVGPEPASTSPPEPITAHYTSKGAWYVDPTSLVEREDVQETFRTGRAIVQKKARAQAG